MQFNLLRWCPRLFGAAQQVKLSFLLVWCKHSASGLVIGLFLVSEPQYLMWSLSPSLAGICQFLSHWLNTLPPSGSWTLHYSPSSSDHLWTIHLVMLVQIPITWVFTGLLVDYQWLYAFTSDLYSHTNLWHLCLPCSSCVSPGPPCVHPSSCSPLCRSGQRSAWNWPQLESHDSGLPAVLRD